MRTVNGVSMKNIRMYRLAGVLIISSLVAACSGGGGSSAASDVVNDQAKEVTIDDPNDKLPVEYVKCRASLNDKTELPLQYNQITRALELIYKNSIISVTPSLQEDKIVVSGKTEGHESFIGWGSWVLRTDEEHWVAGGLYDDDVVSVYCKAAE